MCYKNALYKTPLSSGRLKEQFFKIWVEFYFKTFKKWTKIKNRMWRNNGADI